MSKRLRLSESYSSSNRRSFSNFSKKNFLDLTGVDTNVILSKPFQLDQLIKLKQAQKELKENVLQMIRMYLRSCGDIFNVDGKDSLVDDLMVMFICPLIDYIKEKYKIEDDKLFFERELDFISKYYGTSNADQDSTIHDTINVLKNIDEGKQVTKYFEPVVIDLDNQTIYGRKLEYQQKSLFELFRNLNENDQARIEFYREN